MRRRTYISVLAAGAAGAAGCGEPSAQEADPETPTGTPAATAGPPEVSIVDTYPAEQSLDDGSVVELTVELRNEGGEGSLPLRVDVGDGTVIERSLEVASGRQLEELLLEGVADGYHEYTVAVGETTATGAFLVGTPVERPRVVLEHSVVGQAERNVQRADRLLVDVGVKGDPNTGVAPPDRSALLDICRKLVLEALESRNWDVLRFRIWRRSQTVGEEQPHGTITWGPHGNWSGVGTGAEGDYSRHNFDVTGAPYLVVEDVQAVRADRWTYNVEFDVANHGLERETLSGTVTTSRTDPGRFGVDLEPGGRTTVRYEDTYFGGPRRATYTIEADGDDRLYGPTTGDVEFS